MPRNAKRRRSVCPVACTLDILGDKWTLLVIRDLFCGKSHFREFMQSPERIASNILSDRLERLLQSKLIETAPSSTRSDSHAYVLTDRGRALMPVLESLRDWGLANVAGTRALLRPTIATS